VGGRLGTKASEQFFSVGHIWTYTLGLQLLLPSVQFIQELKGGGTKREKEKKLVNSSSTPGNASVRISHFFG